MELTISEQLFNTIGGHQFCIDTRASFPECINNNTGIRLTLKTNKPKANMVQIFEQDNKLFTIQFVKVHKPKWNHATNTGTPFRKEIKAESVDVDINDIQKTLMELGGW